MATKLLAAAILGLGLLCSASGFAGAAGSAVKVNIINYMGWTDSYEITNGRTKLVVVPQIGGRVMEYSVDGKNVIWQNKSLLGKVIESPKEWPNYGGYKNWNAPQDLWGFPPDEDLDWNPAKVEPLADGVRITGRTSRKYGLTFIKEIHLQPESSKVQLKQWMTSDRDQKNTWSLWDITQVATPGFGAFPINPSSSFPDGVRVWDGNNRARLMKNYVDVKDGIAVISYKKGGDQKFGCDSAEGWAAYGFGNLLYVKRFPNRKAGQKYPDQNLNNELYISGSMAYVEVEVLGPMVRLSKGQSTDFHEEWELIVLDTPVTDAGSFREALKRNASRLHGM